MTAGSGAARRLPPDHRDVQIRPQHAVLPQAPYLPEQVHHPAARRRSAKDHALLLGLVIVAIGLVALNFEEPAVAIFTGLE